MILHFMKTRLSYRFADLPLLVSAVEHQMQTSHAHFQLSRVDRLYKNNAA